MEFNLATLSPWLITTAVVVVVALIGGFATVIGPWYYSLKQPPWKPPDWLFGPAWTVIYVFIITGVVTAWNAAPPGPPRRILLFVFGFNAVVNALWSVVFFTMKRPDWALVEVAILWRSVLAMIVVSLKWSTTAAWLLVVYLLWVSFASALNYAVVRLNPSFGSDKRVTE